MSDEELMTRLVDVDCHESYQELYKRHLQRAKKYLRTFLNPRTIHLLDDIVQESFFKVYTKRHRWPSTCNFLAWFYTVMTRTAIDFLRVERRRRDFHLEDFEFVDPSTERCYQEVTFDPELFQRIPEHERQILALISKGFSMADAAGECGINYQTAYKRYQRAVEKLKASLT